MQKIGTQQSPAKWEGAGHVLLHTYTPNARKDQDQDQGYPLLHNMFEVSLAYMKLCLNISTVGAVSPNGKQCLNIGRKGLGTRTAEERGQVLAQYHSAWMPTSPCKIEQFC